MRRTEEEGTGNGGTHDSLPEKIFVSGDEGKDRRESELQDGRIPFPERVDGGCLRRRWAEGKREGEDQLPIVRCRLLSVPFFPSGSHLPRAQLLTSSLLLSSSFSHPGLISFPGVERRSSFQESTRPRRGRSEKSSSSSPFPLLPSPLSDDLLLLPAFPCSSLLFSSRLFSTT